MRFALQLVGAIGDRRKHKSVGHFVDGADGNMRGTQPVEIRLKLLNPWSGKPVVGQPVILLRPKGMLALPYLTGYYSILAR